MSEKTISFAVNAFRKRKVNDERGEFITFSSYSHNLEKAMQELEDYLHFANNEFQYIYIVMLKGKEAIFNVGFISDEEFYNFKTRVEDARPNDYKEWLLSNYKDGAR